MWLNDTLQHLVPHELDIDLYVLCDLKECGTHRNEDNVLVIKVHRHVHLSHILSYLH